MGESWNSPPSVNTSTLQLHCGTVPSEIDLRPSWRALSQQSGKGYIETGKRGRDGALTEPPPPGMMTHNWEGFPKSRASLLKLRGLCALFHASSPWNLHQKELQRNVSLWKPTEVLLPGDPRAIRNWDISLKELVHRRLFQGLNTKTAVWKVPGLYVKVPGLGDSFLILSLLEWQVLIGLSGWRCWLERQLASPSVLLGLIGAYRTCLLHCPTKAGGRAESKDIRLYLPGSGTRGLQPWVPRDCNNQKHRFRRLPPTRVLPDNRLKSHPLFSGKKIVYNT